MRRGAGGHRRPRHGILEIDKQTQELRLSQEAGSFLVNDGQLFVRDTKITGWREKDNGPATFTSPKEFRPFIFPVALEGAPRHLLG